MARRAPPYRIFARAGVAWIDVRSIPGFERVRETLGVPYGDWARRRASREAQEAAANFFRELVAGRTVTQTDRVLTAQTDEELVALWLGAIETDRNRKSVQTKRTYGRTWHAFFSDEARWNDKRTPLERMVADAGPEDYAIGRLSDVLRKTVRKELTDMFAFFHWAKLRKHIAAIPPRPTLPKGEPGKRSGPQRALPVHVDPAEARAIIDVLPEWSDAARSKRENFHARAFRVRDPNDFMWETTLRPSTIARLSVPENWTRGSKTLVLRDADDKALYGRSLTLTARAQAILERSAPKAGLIFGEHRYDDYIKAAALKVLPREKALRFARYDFRHGRINNLLELTGNMLGVAYQAGHTQLTTTNSYLRAQRRQGDAVISAADEAAGGSDKGTLEARALSESVDPTAFTVGARGFEPPTPRPPARDPNATSREDSHGAPKKRADSRHKSHDRDAMGARSGHAYLADAKRALLVSELVCEAFDLFVLTASEDDS